MEARTHAGTYPRVFVGFGSHFKSSTDVSSPGEPLAPRAPAGGGVGLRLLARLGVGKLS